MRNLELRHNNLFISQIIATNLKRFGYAPLFTTLRRFGAQFACNRLIKFSRVQP